METVDSLVVERGLILDDGEVALIENPNVREVALKARDLRYRMAVDPSVRLQATYSEAYSGEQS